MSLSNGLARNRRAARPKITMFCWIMSTSNKWTTP
jgi:hypothetical protein